uniref:hypothetical protein n=1 Tax=Neorhizobium vignae TaxID=690585 RepID=UPI001A9A3229
WRPADMAQAFVEAVWTHETTILTLTAGVKFPPPIIGSKTAERALLDLRVASEPQYAQLPS